MQGRTDLRRLSLRLLAAWALVSVVVLLAGGPLVSGTLPAMSLVSQALADGYFASLAIGESDGDATLLLTLKALSNQRVGDTVAVPMGVAITAEAHLLHALVPPSLALVLLLAWPADSARAQLRLAVGGVVLAALVLILLTPFHLAGLVETSFVEFAAERNVDREPRLLLPLMLFLEGGGRWMVPILLAVLTALLLQGSARRTQR